MIKALDYIRVVLVEPTHPGNIGAAARAMANMGLRDLYLVRPREFPSEIAVKRAAGANEILDQAKVCDDLDSAINDCVLVMGTTARLRAVEWPQLDPAGAALEAVGAAERGCAAIVFGRESRGLTNAELDRCHYLVRIPVDDGFASLNLGSAVTVLLYEVRKRALVAQNTGAADQDSADLASAEDLQRFYQHLEEVLTEIEFTDGRSSTLMRKLRRLYNRTLLTQEEVNILRGILSSVQWKTGRSD